MNSQQSTRPGLRPAAHQFLAHQLPSSQAALDLLLPVERLLPGLGAQAVGPLAGVQREEALLVQLLRSARRDARRLRHVLDLAQVDGGPRES